jgi:hypothetical protein
VIVVTEKGDITHNRQRPLERHINFMHHLISNLKRKLKRRQPEGRQMTSKWFESFSLRKWRPILRSPVRQVVVGKTWPDALFLGASWHPLQFLILARPPVRDYPADRNPK